MSGGDSPRGDRGGGKTTDRIEFTREMSGSFEFADVTLDETGVTIRGDDGQTYRLADTTLYPSHDSYQRLAVSRLGRELRETRMQVNELLPTKQGEEIHLRFVESRHSGSVNEFVDTMLTKLFEQFNPPRR